MTRGFTLALGLAVGGTVALVATEVYLLTRRTYLPTDPGYRVDARVVPRDGAGRDQHPLRLAVLGDSTVAGVGSHTERESLPFLIAQRAADRLERPVDVVGFGVSGARTASVLADQLPRVSDEFDAVVVVIGSNDATHGTPWTRVRHQTRALLLRARTLGVPVILAGTPRFAGTRIIPEPLRTLVDRYAGVLRAEQRAAANGVPGVRFVDIAADASPRFVGRPDATSEDGFHPSPVGYGFWADAIAPALASELAIP